MESFNHLIINNPTLTLTVLTLKEAEASYLNTGRILEECYEQDGMDQEEKSRTELKISTALSRYRSQHSAFPTIRFTAVEGWPLHA